MSINRRALFGAAAALAAAGSAKAQSASAPTPAAAPPPQKPWAERVAERASENRHALTFDGRSFSGPGWDLLVAAGRRARFTLLGEEHGIAENPKFATELFKAIGADLMVLETSPQAAFALDRAAQGGVDGLEAHFSDPGRFAAFFTMREEAEMLAAVRAAVPKGRPAFWGVDYEIGADHLLVEQLRARPMPKAAKAAVEALAKAQAESYAKLAETKSPQYWFSFSGDPALVQAVRDVWPKPDAESAWLLDTLHGTLETNRFQVTNRYFQANQRRADLNRANLIRLEAEARAAGRKPRALFKMGASHVVRGRSVTEVFDVGALAHEMAAIGGDESFGVLVLPGTGGKVAQFDPSAMRYGPRDGETLENTGLGLLQSAVLSTGFTVIDLRPLRPLFAGSRAVEAGPGAMRAVHGFDALVVMTGSTPSSNLL